MKNLPLTDLRDAGGTPGKSQLGYGLTCDDYLVFNGEKTAMCGSLSKGARDVVLPVRGPQGLTLHTDQIHIPKVRKIPFL